MDILLLNWKDIKNPEVGGAEVIAFEFARRLVKEGYTVTFFSRNFHRCKDKEIIDNVTIIRRGNKLSVYLHALLYYRSLKRKPDIVIDMINTLCWQTPLYIPKEKRIAYVNQLAKEVLFYEFFWPVSWISYILEPLEYLTYKTSRVLCYSQSTKIDLMSFGIPGRNIHVFPLGLDHTRYVPGKEKSRYPLFIFVARLVRMKRGDLCIKAMKAVVEKHPKARLLLIGNGPDEKRLQNLISDLSLTRNIHIINKNNFFIDKSPVDTKVRFMQEAWGLLLPSVKEGWGMVVTEAAACGTPSIVSNVTGLRDSVVDKKTGIILSKQPSSQELADAIALLIENNKLRERLSLGALRRSKEFNWDKSYTRFKHLLLAKYEE